MGRAGRPQFDDQGKAVILVHDIKKDFYKKFLYEPFPVESSLLGVLSDHLNAEIAGGTITSKQDAMDYITWTYFFRRLIMNPSYYNLSDVSHDSVNKFLSYLIEKSLVELEHSYCIEIGEDNRSIEPLTYGRIASYYYLKHQTVKMFKERLKPECSTEELLSILSNYWIFSLYQSQLWGVKHMKHCTTLATLTPYRHKYFIHCITQTAMSYLEHPLDRERLLQLN